VPCVAHSRAGAALHPALSALLRLPTFASAQHSGLMYGPIRLVSGPLDRDSRQTPAMKHDGRGRAGLKALLSIAAAKACALSICAGGGAGCCIHGSPQAPPTAPPQLLPVTRQHRASLEVPAKRLGVLLACRADRQPARRAKRGSGILQQRGLEALRRAFLLERGRQAAQRSAAPSGLSRNCLP